MSTDVSNEQRLRYLQQFHTQQRNVTAELHYQMEMRIHRITPHKNEIFLSIWIINVY